MANTEEPGFLIHFWGVRGSYPTPGDHTLRHGGNTACVEMRVGGHTLIFDAGSGIISMGSSLMQQGDDATQFDMALFLTHAHGDHLIGLPFFSPLFDPRTNLHLFGPMLANRSIEDLITPLMSPPYFPVDIRQLPSHRVFHTIDDAHCIRWRRGATSPSLLSAYEQSEAVPADEVRVCARFTSSHPLNGALIYRVEYAGRRVVYATDVEWRAGCEPSFLDFIAGADVLIHDAQYTEEDYQQAKRGFGHSTLTMATEAARLAGVKELILFHHEPTYNDNQLDCMEAQARTCFAHTRSACEGMEIDLLALKE